MASTYSSLKIQLMGTGENSGTWGNVTNVNLGTAIEEAITGSADVTFSSGTVTLTLTDSNASQSARNLRLNLTGTSGGAQNLIVPTIEKVYIVNNGCADAITVKNSGGTGIAVPAGKTMYVYNDGTNVVDAVTHLTSLTLSTPLANNQTTASASNGASTIVARDASGNFAANVITANGSALTALNATSVSSGTLDNARTSAASANGASTIVARDASGNFVANVITANGSALTALNASSISSGTVTPARLGSGTADNTTFLRGDSTFQVIEAGGGLTDNVRQAVTSSATTTIDVDSGNVVDLTMAANITTLAFSNVPASGTPLQLVIVFRNAADGTFYNVTWPSSIYWNTSTPFAENSLVGPTLTFGPNSITVISLLTTDGGTKWRGWVEADIPGQDAGNFLYTWGANGNGQLGQNDLQLRSSPVQVGALTSWAELRTGTTNSSSTLAIKSDGTMWAWGDNGNGQLGLNDTINRSSPVQIGSDTNWAKISMTTSSPCTFAIRTTGTLWSWGQGNFGVLGQNNTTSLSSPVQIGAQTDWAQVSGGQFHVHAIKTTGTLWSWGIADEGRLGTGNVINRSSPVQVGSDVNWAQVAAGNDFSLARRTNDTMWAWGSNSDGQLGQNNITNRSSPVQIGSDTNWASISSGFSFAIANRTTGTLWAWGDNGSGQLGQNNTDKKSSPVQIGALTNWSTKISAANGCVVIKTDGTLWAWGRSNQGQAGLNDVAPRSSPIQVGAETDWSQISALGNMTAALRAALAVNPA